MGRGHFLGVLDAQKIGWGFGGGGLGSQINKYIGNTSMCKENFNLLTRGLVRGNIRGGLGGKHF